jgi:hypothetical protein
MLKAVMLMIMMISLTSKAEVVIELNGFYHNESDLNLSIKNKVLFDIALANRVLRAHNIDGYRFKLGGWVSIKLKRERFYRESLDGEAHMAYVTIKSKDRGVRRLDFYVRGYFPSIDGDVRGVAVQGGEFFAFTYQDSTKQYYTFLHELFHMIGLGESSLTYAKPYACGSKVTLMDERYLPKESKSFYLSDPNVTVNGQRCGHEIHYDNARRLRELLVERFGKS